MPEGEKISQSSIKSMEDLNKKIISSLYFRLKITLNLYFKSVRKKNYSPFL